MSDVVETTPQTPRAPVAEESSSSISDDVQQPKPITVDDKTSSGGVHVEVPASPDGAFLGLRRGDQIVVGFFVIASFALMAVHWAQLSGWGLQPIEIERQHALPLDYRIDMNRATWVEWIQLPGIGEVLARRIVDDLETQGPFKSIDDLQRVKGIGPKTVEKLRRWMKVGQAESDAADDS